MRKLATIQKISNLESIPNADFLEVATVLGWKCVVKKNEFKIGDFVVYIEIDSILPDIPVFEFMRKYNFRVKTQKLRGQISQGLVMPLSILDPIINTSLPINTLANKYKIDDDVTNVLNIKKYLTPEEKEDLLQEELKIIDQKNKIKKFLMRYSWFRKIFYPKVKKIQWPNWVQKTDEERIQNLNWDIFYEKFKHTDVVVTEKIDGCSGTFTGIKYKRFFGLINSFKFIVCSRNRVVDDKNTIWWRVAEKYDLEKIIRENPNLIIQGECLDTKVQGNKYQIKSGDVKFYIFNIIDKNDNYFYNYFEIVKFCRRYYLMFAPIIKDKTLLKYNFDNIDKAVELSKGRSIINPLIDIQREGVVIRCVENGHKIFSFKVINPEFLLKYNE